MWSQYWHTLAIRPLALGKSTNASAGKIHSRHFPRSHSHSSSGPDAVNGDAGSLLGGRESGPSFVLQQNVCIERKKKKREECDRSEKSLGEKRVLADRRPIEELVISDGGAGNDDRMVWWGFRGPEGLIANARRHRGGLSIFNI